MSVNSQSKRKLSVQELVNMPSAQELDTQTDRRLPQVTEVIAVPTSEHVAQIVGELPLDEDSAYNSTAIFTSDVRHCRSEASFVNKQCIGKQWVYLQNWLPSRKFRLQCLRETSELFCKSQTRLMTSDLTIAVSIERVY